MEKIFKPSLILLIVFSFWFAGGCGDPLFFSGSLEKEAPRKAASKDIIIKREKTESLDEIDSVGYTHRLKAESLDPLPLKEPFIKKTRDFGSAFAQVEKVNFTTPLDKSYPKTQNSAVLTKQLREASFRMDKASPIEPMERQFSKRKKGVFVTEPLKDQSFERAIAFTGNGKGALAGMEPVSFLGVMERQFF